MVMVVCSNEQPGSKSHCDDLLVEVCVGVSNKAHALNVEAYKVGKGLVGCLVQASPIPVYP